MTTATQATARAIEAGPYRQVYVWELPVRLTHWVNFAAIGVASVTGFYIGYPFLAGGGSLMSWMRAVHRLAGYALVAGLLLRVYWSFAGNEWASWRVLFPWLSRDGRAGLWQALSYYLFVRRKPPRDIGHNSLAGLAYSAVVALLAAEVASGFALYSMARGGGWTIAFGWVFWIASPQNVRLAHHLIMWLLLGFAVHHVYSCVLMDVEERNGLITSIFSGYKTVRRSDQ
jgi:Ni/Fe-hydrogenase 1 B-type cytochrome subunit